MARIFEVAMILILGLYIWAVIDSLPAMAATQQAIYNILINK